MDDKQKGYFPEVKGSNLEGKNYNLPGDFEGKINLVFVAFQRWHQDLVDSWMPAALKIADSTPGLCFYELPTLYNANFLYRKMINSGMKSGIPDVSARERTITLYIDKDGFRGSLNIPDEESIHIYLVDRKGNIFWESSGEYNSEKEKNLLKAIKSLSKD